MGEHVETRGRCRGLGARHGMTQVAGGMGVTEWGHTGDGGDKASLGKCPHLP